MKYNFSKFHQRSVSDRLNLLERNKIIDHETFVKLSNINEYNLLNIERADKMIENVIGVFGLPIGLGLNFLVNDKQYVVPMVTEEPSVIAGVSSAAKTIRLAGGFKVHNSRMLLIGQIAVTEVPDYLQAEIAIFNHKQAIIDMANNAFPKMIARGGGAIKIEVHQSDLFVVHLLVDTKDAMGANIVNTMCEAVAPFIEKLAQGNVLMCILSNLHDRSIVEAEATIPTNLLRVKGFTGEQIRDRFILASNFAANDPYRAATHNKGIMNGIDAMALATGNDWRAIEAGAHAYAASGKVFAFDGFAVGGSQYTSLSHWSNDNGNLKGKLKIPLRVGTVGGCLQFNPIVKDMLKILNVESSQELSQVMAAVGLAQNFAILRVLVTEGIQKGHMELHARKKI